MTACHPHEDVLHRRLGGPDARLLGGEQFLPHGRSIDLFEDVQRHELSRHGVRQPVRFAPELSRIQKRVLRLLRVPLGDYLD